MKPKFNIGQVVYVKEEQYVFSLSDISLLIRFRPYKILSISSYDIGTDKQHYSYRLAWNSAIGKNAQMFGEEWKEIYLTDDVNDIFIMVHEKMKEHLNSLEVAY